MDIKIVFLFCKITFVELILFMLLSISVFFSKSFWKNKLVYAPLYL